MAGILLEGAGITDADRAAEAREIYRRGREAAKRRQGFIRTSQDEEKLARAAAFSGKKLQEIVIPAGGHWSGRVEAADYLRIIDLEGRQAVDFLCYDANDTSDRYNAANTIKVNRSIFLGKDTAFYSDRGHRMLTIAEDTLGFHDTIGGCCSSEMNYLRYGIEHTPNCRDNFARGLVENGMSAQDIVANVNFFMYVPVHPDGTTALLEGASSPGDFVDLRAEMDLLCVISNCPQIYNPCNGWTPSPVRLITWRKEA